MFILKCAAGLQFKFQNLQIVRIFQQILPLLGLALPSEHQPVRGSWKAPFLANSWDQSCFLTFLRTSSLQHLSFPGGDTPSRFLRVAIFSVGQGVTREGIS